MEVTLLTGTERLSWPGQERLQGKKEDKRRKKNHQRFAEVGPDWIPKREIRSSVGEWVRSVQDFIV